MDMHSWIIFYVFGQVSGRDPQSLAAGPSVPACRIDPLFGELKQLSQPKVSRVERP